MTLLSGECPRVHLAQSANSGGRVGRRPPRPRDDPRPRRDALEGVCGLLVLRPLCCDVVFSITGVKAAGFVIDRPDLVTVGAFGVDSSSEDDEEEG